MEKKFIATGKDFDAAVQAALCELGLELEDVSVQLLERAKSGVFGIGARPCKVEVTYQVPDPAPRSALSAASRSKPKKAEPAPQPKTEEPRHLSSAPGTDKQEALRPEKAPRPERKPKKEPKAPRGEVKPYITAQPGTTEEAIEVFLKGLMDHMGSQAVPQAQCTGEGSYHVELVGQDLGMLIGRRGETLDAIQHLTNYAVNRGLEGRVRINVDAENYRVKREESLRRYARKKAQQVLKVRRRTTLEPMNAYERHVIHAALQDMENITTYSTGTEPNRRVIIEYVR